VLIGTLNQTISTAGAVSGSVSTPDIIIVIITHPIPDYTEPPTPPPHHPTTVIIIKYQV